MEHLFNDLLTDTSTTLTPLSACIAMLAALLFGGVIAFTYYKTQKESYTRSMAITLLMLPIILSVIILFVGSNIARAFSLAGTLSIIRFRSAPGDPKDIGFIFFDIAAGLSCGVGLYGYGALFVVVLCVVMFIIEACGLFEKKDMPKTLRITIPESLHYQGVFDDILAKYAKEYTLTRIKTTDLGSLFELSYSVTMRDACNDKELIDELRCRNGNLNITLSTAPNVIK